MDNQQPTGGTIMIEKDLLDLCRLNLMEEHIRDSPGAEAEAARKAIEWKRRQLVMKIVANVDRNEPQT
jgi:hypothetical protein